MSSFFDEASLVFIPSGYKTSKAYSVKPTSGDGDLAFTRSNDTATRVNSAGLIERVRTNLALYSNDFSNAAWAKVSTGVGVTPVVTPNYTTDPFGGNNGWRLQCDLNGGTTNSDRSWLQQTIAGTTVPTTVSVYAKLNSAGTATFSVTNGSTDSVTITSTEWVRVSSVRTSAATSYLFRIGLIGGVGQSGSIDISIAFAQLEISDFGPTAYIPTTTAAVSVGPVANVPRLDYTDSTCPKLLLEPQRTNLAIYSEQFDNAAWSNVSATVTANTAISPSGYQDADRVLTTAGRLQQNVSLTNGTAYTYSIFAKEDAGSTFNVQVLDGTNPRVDFDLSTQTVINAAGGVGKIENYGNGWYRCSMTFTSSFTGSVTFRGIWISTGLYFWGAQLEAGAYATSYIPTLGAAVTRGADAASKTGISSLINSVEGTIYFEASANALNTGTSVWSISNGTAANTLYAGWSSTNNSFVAQLVVGGAAQTNFVHTLTDIQQLNKFAVVYKNNDHRLYINGVLIATDNVGSTPTAGTFDRLLTNLGQGSFPFYGDLASLLLFPTVLSDTEAIALTTL